MNDLGPLSDHPRMSAELGYCEATGKVAHATRSKAFAIARLQRLMGGNLSMRFEHGAKMKARWIYLRAAGLVTVSRETP